MVSTLGLILFNIFFDDIDSGIECKPSIVVQLIHLRDDIQKEPDRLEERAHAKFVLNKAKSVILLHMGQGNHQSF